MLFNVFIWPSVGPDDFVKSPDRVPTLSGKGRACTFYHQAARGPLALARWVNCRPPAGGTIHLTFLIGCKRIEA